MDVQINLIDELIDSGYTIEELNKLATVIQVRIYKNHFYCVTFICRSTGMRIFHKNLLTN